MSSPCCSITNVDVSTITVETQVQPPVYPATNVDVNIVTVETQVQPIPPISISVAEQGPPGPPIAIEYAPDTDITNKSNSDLLIWNEATQKWENKKLDQYVGPLSHTGLIPTEGFEIDQIKTITVRMTLTENWQDVPAINSSILVSGTYIVQLYANDRNEASGTNDHEYYSGIMSWYDGMTRSAIELPTDEIALHRAGASGGDNDAGLFLRTFRSQTDEPEMLKLQIFSNQQNVTASNYVFRFRRLI